MAYNNYFPMGYQQYYPQQTNMMQQQNTQAPQQNNSIIWVQGEAGAKAYPVAPGNSVLLMDSESECFYIKSTDHSGVPMPLRSFTYTEIVQSQQPNEEPKVDTSQFVTRSEFEELKKMLQERQPMRRENRNEQTLSRNSKQQRDE